MVGQRVVVVVVLGRSGVEFGMAHFVACNGAGGRGGREGAGPGERNLMGDAEVSLVCCSRGHWGR